jgi:hypothetical protein
MIFKFVIWIAEGTTDKKWKNAASVLNEGVLKASIYFIFYIWMQRIGRSWVTMPEQPPKMLAYAPS